MNNANFVSHTPEEDGRGMIYPSYSAPPDEEGSPSMEFTWAHPTANGLYSPRQILAREPWVRSTNFEHFASTNHVRPEPEAREARLSSPDTNPHSYIVGKHI